MEAPVKYRSCIILEIFGYYIPIGISVIGALIYYINILKSLSKLIESERKTIIELILYPLSALINFMISMIVLAFTLLNGNVTPLVYDFQIFFAQSFGFLTALIYLKKPNIRNTLKEHFSDE